VFLYWKMVRALLAIDLMDAIPLCDIIKAYTDIYVNTQQIFFNTNLFCAWRHVSAAVLNKKNLFVY